jgi:DTW domain-containing protein YfiP
MPERATHEEVPTRETCYECFRPRTYCLCSVLPSIDNRTLVSIVQHPRERVHPFGTARLAALGLRRSEILVDHLGRLRRSPALLGSLEGAALLYPHADARDVTTLPALERPRRLIVIDGTWHHARTLYRDISILATLPHLTLPCHLRSAFQIRRQPAEYCLSTIEAIVFALRALEPETAGVERLLEAFGSMQGRQLALPRNAGRHQTPRRPDASRAIPRPLVEGYESLVVAYVEATEPTAPGAARRLICCAAARPASGEHFHRLIEPGALSAAHLAHLGLPPDARDQAIPLEQFRAEWAEFLGDASLATWNHAALHLLCDAAARPRAGIALKSAYHNLRQAGGSLEDIVAREGLAPSEHPARQQGRAAARLENALQLAAFLHHQSQRRTA